MLFRFCSSSLRWLSNENFNRNIELWHIPILPHRRRYRTRAQVELIDCQLTFAKSGYSASLATKISTISLYTEQAGAFNRIKKHMLFFGIASQRIPYRQLVPNTDSFCTFFITIHHDLSVADIAASSFLFNLSVKVQSQVQLL